MKLMDLFGDVIELKKGGKVLIYLALGYFSYLMILITLQYIPIDFDVAFLSVKQKEIRWVYYQIAFFTHVYTSIFVLLFGLLQFSASLRKKYARFHRFVGKLYVFLIIGFAGPSGLIMGYHAKGGVYAQISFCLLSVLWMYTTWKAYTYARQRKWAQHYSYIIRSYALTLSAISLRLFKWIIVSILALPPIDIYQIVAWVGWVFNLVVAEIIIRNAEFKGLKVSLNGCG